MISGRLPLLVAALVASAAALTETRAAPLDAEACTKLQAEHGELERTGIEKDMQNGPDWAKANLGVEKLQRVQRYIELEELLLFRCRSKALVHLSPEREWTTDQDADDNDDKEAAPNAGKAGAAQSDEPKQKPDTGKTKTPQPAARPPRAPPAKSAAGEPAEPGVTSIEKRSPPRAKVDDAYKAPPPDPSIDPFATQVNPR